MSSVLVVDRKYYHICLQSKLTKQPSSFESSTNQLNSNASGAHPVQPRPSFRRHCYLTFILLKRAEGQTYRGSKPGADMATSEAWQPRRATGSPASTASSVPVQTTGLRPGSKVNLYRTPSDGGGSRETKVKRPNPDHSLQKKKKKKCGACWDAPWHTTTNQTRFVCPHFSRFTRTLLRPSHVAPFNPPPPFSLSFPSHPRAGSSSREKV